MINQVYALKALQARVQEKLAFNPSKPEDAVVITDWLLEHYLLVSRTDLLLNKQIEVSPAVLRQIDQAVARLLNQEPIQYVLEEAYFYGRKFKVSPSVLIPRRETEELVAMVKQGNPQSGLKLLDVGTGSGCIAITFAKEMDAPNVHALEISGAAVQLAKENAANHQAKVAFITGDLFDKRLSLPLPFDVVVSNPPYVRQSEAKVMKDRVLRHEPKLALFVSDKQPLRYYEQIAYQCQHGWLRRGGKIYWEINEVLGKETVALLENGHFGKIALQKDMQGKNRFVSATLL